MSAERERIARIHERMTGQGFQIFWGSEIDHVTGVARSLMIITSRTGSHVELLDLGERLELGDAGPELRAYVSAARHFGVSDE